MAQTLFIFCLLNIIYLGSSSLVPYVTKCNAGDTECITNSAKAVLPHFVKGIPELHVENLDPVSLKKPVDASTPGLELKLKDLVVTGLSSCKIEKIYRDKENNKIGGKLLCDHLLTEGEYEMDGKLLVVQVKGKGKIRVVLNKHSITVDCDTAEKKGKDGKTYWDIKRFTHSFELLEKTELNFENLHSGSDVLDQAANQVIESSSNEIITEIGAPVIKAIATKVVENIKKFFNNVPPEDLALD